MRTHKLKITSPHPTFDEVVVNYKKAANWLSGVIFRHGKSDIQSSASLQKEFYGTVRENFHLPSQVACSLFRYVVATYKTMKSNGDWTQAVYKKDTIPVVWKRDFNWTRGHLTFWGERAEFVCRKLPTETWGDSKLKKIKGQWYLCLVVEKIVPETKTLGGIVGVDSGQKVLLTAVDLTSKKTLYISGSDLNHRRLNHRKTRARVASVGSRSCYRLLKRLAGKEKAVTQELCHVASKQLVTWAESVGAKVIVMEDLAGIRDSKKPLHHKQKARNHRWPFAQTQFYISYKAEEKGIGMEFVEPRNTSRTCRVCGHTEKANRNGSKFRCVSCGTQDHADRNGAINIARRSLLFWGNPEKERGKSDPYSSHEDHRISELQAPQL